MKNKVAQNTSRKTPAQEFRAKCPLIAQRASALATIALGIHTNEMPDEQTYRTSREAIEVMFYALLDLLHPGAGRKPAPGA